MPRSAWEESQQSGCAFTARLPEKMMAAPSTSGELVNRKREWILCIRKPKRARTQGSQPILHVTPPPRSLCQTRARWGSQMSRGGHLCFTAAHGPGIAPSPGGQCHWNIIAVIWDGAQWCSLCFRRSCGFRIMQVVGAPTPPQLLQQVWGRHGVTCM